MPEQNNKPKVVVALYGHNDDAIKAVENQTYKNTSLYLDVASNGRTAPTFFNDAISDKTNDADIYAFIDENCILSPKCIEEVVNKYLWSEDQFFGACYSDYSLVQDNIESNQYYFSYNLKRLKQNIINPYIFVNGQIVTRIFNEQLDTLYYYDALVKVGMNAMIYHIPKKLMTIYNTPKDIQKDIQRLSNNVRS